MREREIQAKIRYQASQLGWRLWRNNVGGLYDATGRFVRYGLCNESAQQNRKLKSSDLIGIRPVQTLEGRTIGQFVAIEVKAPGGFIEPAQQRFIDLVNALGGYGLISHGDL